MIVVSGPGTAQSAPPGPDSTIMNPGSDRRAARDPARRLLGPRTGAAHTDDAFRHNDHPAQIAGHITIPEWLPARTLRRGHRTEKET